VEEMEQEMNFPSGERKRSIQEVIGIIQQRGLASYTGDKYKQGT